MAHVRFFVNGKVGERARVGDAVILLQAGNLLRGDFRHLRFVCIERSGGLRERSARYNFIECIQTAP